MGVPHPVPYQGSKRKLARAILACFPPDAEKLFEPFAGSAAVSLAAAHLDKARHFFLNDINAPLMDLWGRIINQPREIAGQYGELWEAQQGREREYYDHVRVQFNTSHRPDHFLYLLARCVKGSVRYNANGGFNQSPDNRRKGAHPDVMQRQIMQASRLFRGKCTISACDYRQAIEHAAPGDVVYFDPPYQGVSKNRDPRYIEGLSFDAFAHTLESLNDKGISFVVSYDGRTGPKRFGRPLPLSLELEHIEVDAGRSTQATLLGRQSTTYESLYLSPALMQRISEVPRVLSKAQEQLELFKVSE